MNKVSAIIITKNEEANIARCIESLSWCNEIIVVDSGSTDRTKDIVLKYTDNFFEEIWQGFGKQKNIALSKAKFDWVISLDADEYVSEELKLEIQDSLKNNQFDGFLIPRKSNYLGKFINYSGWYPDYVLRIGKRDSILFSDDFVHEKMIINGSVSKLSSDLIHYPYKSISHHFEKINLYSELSSQKIFESGRRYCWLRVFTAPIFAFVRAYIFKLGFLDGWRGLVISISTSISTYLKYVKTKEKEIFNSDLKK